MSIFRLSVAGREFDTGLGLVRDSLGALFTLAIAKINTLRNIMPKWHHYKYSKVRRSADRLRNNQRMTGGRGAQDATDMAIQVSHSRGHHLGTDRASTV